MLRANEVAAVRLSKVASMVALATVMVGCRSVGSAPAPIPPNSQAVVETPGSASASDLARAQAVLDQWDALMSTSAPDTIVMTDDLTAGGGWTGDDANNDKIAFMGGAITADTPLSTEIPPPATVTWVDGSTSSVELISAADALNGMIAEAGDASCKDCTSVVVTGAELTVASHTTTRGHATLPVWQFNFRPGHQPIQPISYVAIKGATWRTENPTNESNTAWVDDDLTAAYGDANSTSLTVSFAGAPHAGDSPCGADYSAQAVESDRAVAIIVIDSHRVPTTGAACRADAAFRTAVATLSRPLGNRVILEIRFGTPVTLEDGPPPTDPLK